MPLTDNNLFMDVEVYKCPVLKSLLKHNNTYNKFIIYNINNQRWYCISCLLFSKDPIILGEIYSTTSVNAHKNSKSHKESMKMFKSLLNNLQNNQTLLINSTHSISTNNKKVWKYFFMKMFNCMSLCLSSIHSIYGETTRLTSPHCGIFLKLLLLTGKNDELFNTFLKENQYIYQSVRSTQKWIELISNDLMRSLRNRIGNRIYSITTDGTTCHNIEQLVVTIRFCNDNFAVNQYFLSMMEETSPSGVKIAQNIKACLDMKELDIKDLCSVSYDNCICNTSNISGIVSGLKQPPGTILGYGCRAHLLNLALLDLQNSTIDSFLYITLINDVAVSWAKCSRLRVIIKNHNFSKYTLPQVSQTRFIARYYSIIPYVAHPKQTLCKIFLLYFYSYNKKNVCNNNSEKMLQSFGELSFHIFLECWFRILCVVNHASSQLQSETLTVNESMKIIKRLYNDISNLSSSDNITEMYANAIQRREYIYSFLDDLVKCFERNKYDNTSDYSINSILQIMKKIPDYSSKWNKLSMDEWKNNIDVLEAIECEEDECIMKSNDNDDEIIELYGKNSELHSTFSFTESIRSILNHRDEAEKKNFDEMCLQKGLNVNSRKRTRQNVLINRDNDSNMAPVIENRNHFSHPGRNDKIVSNINLFTAEQYIDYVMNAEIEKRNDGALSSKNCEKSLNILPKGFQIQDDDICILYDSLFPSSNSETTNASGCANSQVTEIQPKNNSCGDTLLSISPFKRCRGRPRKNRNDIQCDSDCFKETNTIISGCKRSTTSYSDFGSSNYSNKHEKRLQNEQNKNISNDEKKKMIITTISSQQYNIMFKNEKNNVYRFSANFNLMILQLKQNLASRLFKNIIQDLSICYFISTEFILQTESSFQNVFVDTFYGLFSSRFSDNYCIEMEKIMSYLKETAILTSSIASLVDLVRNHFPKSYILYKQTVELCLTINPTSIKSESSFSILKRVKSYSQNGMKGNLLEAYMSCTCNECLLSSLNASKIVDDYMDGLHLQPLSNTLIQRVLKTELLKTL
ncbi:hypothetical protein WA158_006253 [Blastocystis sp. Blastoise]